MIIILLASDQSSFELYFQGFLFNLGITHNTTLLFHLDLYDGPHMLFLLLHVKVKDNAMGYGICFSYFKGRKQPYNEKVTYLKQNGDWGLDYFNLSLSRHVIAISKCFIPSSKQIIPFFTKDEYHQDFDVRFMKGKF